MKKEFIEKVKRMGIYDTFKYRYAYKTGPNWERIDRIERRYLDTTRSLKWETVFYKEGFK